MKTDLFAHEVTQTSAVFGRKSEVKVVFEGEGARTDHQTIVLPSLPLGVEIDEKSQKIIRGYSDHEAGHLRHTDRKVIEDNEPMLRANPKLHQVWNALEDVWLERRVIEEYPGSMENIRETATAVDEAALRAYTAGDEVWTDDKFVGPVAITWEGRKGYGHDSGKKCLERVTPEMRANAEVWVGALDACNSTKDVMELAKWIHGELQKPLEKDPPKPETGKGKPEKGEGEGDKGKGDEPDGDEASEESGEGKPTGEPGDEAKEGKPITSRPDHEHMSFEMKDAVERETKKLIKAGGTEAYRPYSLANDKFHTRFDDENKYHPSDSFGSTMRYYASREPGAYNERLSEVSGNLNVVRRKLERSLMAKMNRAWTGGHVHGRLDAKRLVSAYRGGETVYKLRDPAPELDTAVEILVDLSGSMGGSKASLARDVCVVLAEVLSKSGIPFEITGFNNRSSPIVVDKKGRRVTSSARVLQETHRGFHRYEPLDIYVFKAFDERFSEAKPYIAQIDEWAGANNSDSEALLMVVPRLEARLERRKVFMVLSDGLPEFYGNSGRGRMHLNSVVNGMVARGIECIGIGIQSNAVSQFYPRYVVVHRLEDLGKQAIDQLAKVLLGERYVVDNASLMEAV
jgi:cobalamin biosynthesis protein CobT